MVLKHESSPLDRVHAEKDGGNGPHSRERMPFSRQACPGAWKSLFQPYPIWRLTRGSAEERRGVGASRESRTVWEENHFAGGKDGFFWRRGRREENQARGKATEEEVLCRLYLYCNLNACAQQYAALRHIRRFLRIRCFLCLRSKRYSLLLHIAIHHRSLWTQKVCIWIFVWLKE